MTAVKSLKVRRGSGPYATLDLATPSSAANSFITEIGTWFLRGRGNWLPAGVWVSLLGSLDVPEATARTALHRMTQAGYLERESHAGRPGYGMSPSWIKYIGESAEDLDD